MSTRQPKTRLEDDQTLVQKLLDVDEGLTDWEVDFVDNLGRQVIDEGRELSTKQRQKAEQIAQEHGL